MMEAVVIIVIGFAVLYFIGQWYPDDEEQQDSLDKQRQVDDFAKKESKAEIEREEAEETLKREEAERKRQELLRMEPIETKRLILEIKRHRSALTRNLEKAVKRNDYGKIIADNSYEVIREFLESVDIIGRNFPSKSVDKIVFEQLDILKKEDQQAGFDLDTMPTDGHEFEHWVADGLKIYGWEAKVTSGSGDQGIDVIATMNDKKVGLQCKLLASSVGNKAVQEAFTGKAFYKTDAVAVISNAPYTPSAQELAADTNVKLLSQYDIPDLYDKVFDA